MLKNNNVSGKAGPGRPKGSKDKSYLTLQYWYEELMKDWPKLKPAQRAKLTTQLMQMLTNKLKQLPQSPEDSVLNATAAQEMLSVLEGKGIQTNESSKVIPHNPTLPPVVVDKTDYIVKQDEEGKGLGPV